MAFFTPILVDEIDVPQRLLQSPVRVQIFDGVDPRLLPVSGSLWDEVAIELCEPDFAWSMYWISSIQDYIAEGRPYPGIYSIVSGGLLQGITMMYGRENAEIYNEPFIYVDRLSSAPWNRRIARQKSEWADIPEQVKEFPELIGIGLILANICAQHSNVSGFDERVAGIVVPTSINFHRRLGYESVGAPLFDGSQWMRRPVHQ